MYDLICGLLLQSGNDCAAAIAEHISGSQEAFAELMNTEAKQLGATGTHFVNPHGLHDENHYTTTYDLYLMFNEALKDQAFLDIISIRQKLPRQTELRILLHGRRRIITQPEKRRRLTGYTYTEEKPEQPIRQETV